MTTSLRIVAISGSLRARSLNTALLRHAQRLAPPGVSIHIHDIADLPLFNQDLEGPAFPDSVARLHAAVAGADAVLLSVPEYNHAPSGVLKNALDWMSRPVGRSTATGKPVAMVGVATGMGGTIRAQAALRPTLNVMGMFALIGADCVIPHAAQNFDADGGITGATVEAALTKTLDALRAWTLRLDPQRQPVREPA